MALVIAMQPKRSFFIGHTQVVVEESRNPTHAKLRVVGPIDLVVELSPNHRVELVDSVFAQLGNDSSPNMVKVVLEAPREVRILRDVLYYENHPEKAEKQ